MQLLVASLLTNDKCVTSVGRMRDVTAESDTYVNFKQNEDILLHKWEKFFAKSPIIYYIIII